jgi:hypothetical protein
MDRHEEAGSFDLAGVPLSRHEGRVSLSWTKPSLRFSEKVSAAGEPGSDRCLARAFAGQITSATLSP